MGVRRGSQPKSRISTSSAPCRRGFNRHTPHAARWSRREMESRARDGEGSRGCLQRVRSAPIAHAIGMG